MTLITPTGAMLQIMMQTLDPITNALSAKGINAILIGAVPSHAVVHTSFATPVNNLENDLTRLADYYRDNAARMQIDAIKKRLRPS